MQAPAGKGHSGGEILQSGRNDATVKQEKEMVLCGGVLQSAQRCLQR